MVVKICIDPGHGGTDPGAIGFGVKEKDINLIVARKLRDCLIADYDVQCFMTRYDDKTVSLSDRARFANNNGVDLFISLHCNAATDNRANGLEVWTSKGDTNSDHIASVLLDKIDDIISIAIRTDTIDGDPDKESNFTVLVGTQMPAILIEMGFITNPNENKRLQDPNFQNCVVAGIVNTIEGIFDLGPKPAAEQPQPESQKPDLATRVKELEAKVTALEDRDKQLAEGLKQQITKLMSVMGGVTVAEKG